MCNILIKYTYKPLTQLTIHKYRNLEYIAHSIIMSINKGGKRINHFFNQGKQHRACTTNENPFEKLVSMEISIG